MLVTDNGTTFTSVWDDGVGNRLTTSNATGSITHTPNNELTAYGKSE